MEIEHLAPNLKPRRWKTLLNTQVLLWFLLNSRWCFKVLKYLINLSRRSDPPGSALVVIYIGFKRLVVRIDGRQGQILKWLGQILSNLRKFCLSSLVVISLVPWVLPGPQHTVFAQKMKYFQFDYQHYKQNISLRLPLRLSTFVLYWKQWNE